MSDLPYGRLAGFYLAYFAALGLFSPYWGAYLETRGLNEAQIAVLMSLWFGARMIIPIPWNWCAEHYGGHQRWLRAGALLTLAGCASFLLPLSYWQLLVVMLLFSIVYNAIMPQFEALTLAHLGARRSLYGRIRVWGTVGFGLTVTLGGALLEQVGYGQLVGLLLPVFAILLLVAWINREPADMASQARPSLTDLSERLRRPAVSLLLLVAMMMQMGHGPYYVYFAIYLDQLGFGPAWVGAYWAIGLGLEVAVFLLMPRVLARWSARRVMALCLLVAALRWLVVALLPTNVPLMLLAQAGHALTFGAFHAATMLLLAEHFPGRLGGQGQGLLYALSGGLGGVLGSLVAGWAWANWGGSGSFLAAALIAALAIGICPWLKPPAREAA
ncbi:MAG: MFS transporter [Xanthomonadales bacterium]|nr:MFS transporter [Xanthomonadales bacterium]